MGDSFEVSERMAFYYDGWLAVLADWIKDSVSRRRNKDD